MTAFTDAYTAYSGSNKDTRARLWELCVAAHSSGSNARILSEQIGRGQDTVQDWITVGWLINYTRRVVIHGDGDVFYPLSSLWSNSDALSYDHLLRMAKQAKRHEIDPDEILEWLYGATTAEQKAEAMERDIREAYEEEKVLGVQDLQTIRRRLQQNFGSMKFRKFISDETARLWELLDRSIAIDLQRLAPQGSDEPQ